MIESTADSRVFADSQLFEEVIRHFLDQGLSIRFQARGASMSPAIRDGEVVEVTPVMVTKLRKDDIVLAKSNAGFRLHRIVMAQPARDVFITCGDCGQENDAPLKSEQILGLARSKEVRLGRNIVKARFKGVGGWMLRSAARAQSVAGKIIARPTPWDATRCRVLLWLNFLSMILILGTAAARAQVAVDATTNGSGTLNGGAATLTFAHNTTNTANRLLIVGVSINIPNGSSPRVLGVTYNGVGLHFIGAHNDAGGTRRVEMWYLLAPTSGGHSVIVTVNTAGQQDPVVAGATTFTGVDQTVPLGSFVSADGAAAVCTGIGSGCSSLDVPSVVNGMVLDTLATGGDQTVAASGPQTAQWNQNTGNTATDVRGTGSSRTGAPSVPISETFSGTSNWSLGAVSINPSSADVAVSTSVSAVALGQNSTYNITVTNNGLSAANNVVLTDTLATGPSLISVTPSGGTTCSGTGPITCNLPTPFASGATATVTVVVNASTAGFYPNTATVTDSGTPPDPNTGNNTYVAVAPVVSVVCATNTPPNGGTLTGVQNTYFPGTASVSAGATSIPIGTANGSGTIQAGSELLIIQMQDASINTSNTVAYGNGYTGAGFTAINNAGNYEFATATGPVSGGSVPIFGAGPGGGLVFAYTNAAASATKGQSTYQVVLVPQYTTATLSSSVTAAPWNGTTGGILALDIGSTLNLGGATVSVDGMGFRGGAGMQLVGGFGGTNTDYQYKSPTTYTGATGGATGVDAAKGEGVAGTPEWVESGGTFLQTTTGYPSGTAGTDGSMARGAPGNAGAGGTDSNSAANDQNAGGGGGGNGGSGGFGGDSWNTNLSSGGEGGAVFPSTIDRIALGGGGGAGTRNNSDTDNQASSGSAGGGIIFIRAYNFSGTATLTANGLNSYNGTKNDAGGGGGAGGTIIMLAANGGEAGLTLQANGGRGGDAWDAQAFALNQRHGPGGGGGGGVIYLSGNPASISVSGGANGTTLNPGVAYGATPGSSGTTSTTATVSQVTGLQSTAVCTRVGDLTISKSHGGVNFTRGAAASYTLTVSNVSPLGAASGLVTVNDTLPSGITPTGAAGTGWSCSVSGQTVSCIRSDSLAAGVSYPSITLNATVSQSAPATLTNTATVSGGGDVTPLNNSATDIANVVSSADLSVTDAASPNPVAIGGNITYTIVATNNGPSAADNATLVLPAPNNTGYVSLAAPAGWSCLTAGTGGGSSFVCTNANFPGSSTATFTYVVKVSTNTTNGTVITGSATVSSSVVDPILSNNTATVSTIVGTSGPNLFVTNVAAPNPVQAGNPITYTQIVTNTGSSAITNGTFSEATPANTTFVSIAQPAGWSCTGFPATPCTAATVAAGASGIFTLVYTINGGTAAGTVITDTATVNATNQSFGASSATATDVVALATQADVRLNTAATPSAVYAGNNITYTQAVTNSGPAAAAGVVFTQATPTNTTFQSVLAPAGWTCTTPAVGGTGTITCNDTANLNAATSADIVVVLNVPSTVASGTITASSSVTASTSDPNSANNSTTVLTPVTVSCDLSVTNSGSPNPVGAGANITYIQVVKNLGPSNCSTATLREPNPNNSGFVSVGVVNSGGGTWTCLGTGPVSCSSASVAPGATGTVTAVYRVNGGTTAGTLINDTVTVTTTTHDTSLSNNTATVTIPVSGGGLADLSVTNSASPNPVTAGSNITYTQSVMNAGQATANRPVFTETLPAGTTAVSLTGPATGWTCVLASLTCTATANMGVGTANFTFVVKVGATVANGTVLSQTDSVSSTTGDPNPANNNATVNVGVADTADLSVTNTPNPVPVQAATTITYTQAVTNSGPSAATTASLTETLPANTTAQTLTATGGWTCNVGTLTCTNPSFGTGSATITYTVLVIAGTPAGTAINETVSISSAITDPNTSNNSATAADVVATTTLADLVVTNSPSPSSVAAGSNVTYTQTVTNNGFATATGATFSQTTPPNTNFQSITPPAGWTCGTTPSVGGTGTITCTATGTLAVNSVGTFTLVLQVNSGTTSGTSITDTATATATNIVPNLTTNTASATVIVANANSADVAIVKTATPNPVTQGTPLTYTLTVTNNGPASATNVTVTDTLPSSETYLSSTTGTGSCSEAGGTVTCLLGTMANPATVSISILAIPGQPGVVSNTATVTADQTDPNPANNTSTQNETVISPTRITLQSFSAHYGTDKNGANRVVLTWRTGGESHNLGFNVYREQNGNRVRMNPSIVAGSALMMRGNLPRHAARSYAWIDPSAPTPGATYWLEDIDVNGSHSMHGPVIASGRQASAEAAPSETRMLSQLNQALPAVPGSHDSHFTEMCASDSRARWQFEKQFEITAHPAVKIDVRHEGWYSIGQPALVKAGLDPNVDPAQLHLYAEAVEQPIRITGATAGPGGFGPQASISFYGTGINTVYSGTRVYWLTAEDGRGARMQLLRASSGSNQPPADYTATVELQQHTVYFAALITSNGDNFFGALVSPTPVDQTLEIPHLDAASTQVAKLEVSLQGVILGFPHDVSVALNGTNLGDITFTGQDKGKLSFDIPAGVLKPWSNTVTLTAQNGDYDTSLVDYIRISYPHRYLADSDQLRFTGRAGEEIEVGNFTSIPVVLDITDPNRPVQLTARSTLKDNKYDIAIQVPFTTTNPDAPADHVLLAVADDRISTPAAVWPNRPSHWHSPQPGADIAMVTHGPFAAALSPVVQAHRAEGKTSAVIPITELYDEFNFGEHSPFAIKRFLESAKKNWKKMPGYLLLNGRASLDPRNYLGFGNLDLVPTAIVPSAGLMTASDDWFSDFENTGMPTIATGRLPVSTADEAASVAAKIATYEGHSTDGPWTSNALFVADKDDTESFTQDSHTVEAMLPSNMQISEVFVDNVGTASARTDIVNAINSGQVLVNYLGHGSEEQWAGPDIFDENTVNSLTNSSQLPVFLIMDCLNGFFQDVYAEPLGVSLMLASNGGGVAVLASSGLNQPTPQTSLDAAVVQAAFAAKGITIGDAVVNAKLNITDPDVRQTFILFGDPAMKVKATVPGVSVH